MLNSSSSDEEHSYSLNKKFFLTLIHQERQFAKKIDSIDQIQDLMNMYGKCVEFFDTLCNPAKWYFMEKIQNTLAEANAFEMILKQEDDRKKLIEKQRQIKPVTAKECNIKYDPLKRQILSSGNKKKNLNQELSIATKPFKQHDHDISFTKNRQVRSKMLTMTAQLYEQKEINKQEHIIQQWDEDVNQAGTILTIKTH